MADINTEATLYNMNKNLIAQEPVLTRFQIKQSLRNVVEPFFKDCKNQYFMLLCREQYDFTLFNFFNKEKTDSALKNSEKDCYECLTNRGNVISIELTEQKDAVEIWIKIDDNYFVYYLFPYDLGVIEVKL